MTTADAVREILRLAKERDQISHELHVMDDMDKILIKYNCSDIEKELMFKLRCIISNNLVDTIHKLNQI